jgi:hypothetical protein
VEFGSNAGGEANRCRKMLHGVDGRAACLVVVEEVVSEDQAPQRVLQIRCFPGILSKRVVVALRTQLERMLRTTVEAHLCTTGCAESVQLRGEADLTEHACPIVGFKV